LEEKGKNWEEYKRVFERLAYTYGWNLGLINLDVVAHPWNQGAETAEQTQDRKNIFILLTSTAGPYKYLFHNVANGNAQAAWKALNEEFDARNVAEYNDLVDKFANANQANLGLGVGEYIAKINTLGARLLARGGEASDEHRTAVLMKAAQRFRTCHNTHLSRSGYHIRGSKHADQVLCEVQAS
jgi:hypothetical protein